MHRPFALAVAARYRLQHGMKVGTVAEFVHNDAVPGAMRAIGVDYAQGYGVRPPVSMDTGGRRSLA